MRLKWTGVEFWKGHCTCGFEQRVQVRRTSPLDTTDLRVLCKCGNHVVLRHVRTEPVNDG